MILHHLLLLINQYQNKVIHFLDCNNGSLNPLLFLNNYIKKIQLILKIYLNVLKPVYNNHPYYFVVLFHILDNSLLFLIIFLQNILEQN